MFTESDYWRLYGLVFRDDYSGYKPDVVELPNGDGKADVAKRYAHVALKYMTTEQQRRDLWPYLRRAHDLAVGAAIAMGVPQEFMPEFDRGALRVLEYPPGATSARHTDFDLFTLMMYRDEPENFLAYDGGENHSNALARLQRLNPQGHLGELAQELGLGLATPHEVVAGIDYPQHSIVYFAIPPWEAVLPSGVTVGDWLAERLARSRTYR